MPRHDKRGFMQGIETFANRLFDRIEIPAPQVRTTDTATEQRITCQNDVSFRNMETHRARRVSRGMEGHCSHLADQNFFFILQPIVRRRHRCVRNAEHTALRFKHGPQVPVVFVQTERRTRRLLHLAGCEKVIEMGMGMENHGDRQAELLHFMENTFVGSTRIDNDRLLRQGIADDRAIASQGRDGKRFSNQRSHVCTRLNLIVLCAAMRA